MGISRLIAVVIALMLAAVACAGGQSASTPDAGAPVEASIRQEVGTEPTAAPVGVVSQVNSTTPEPIPTNTPVPTDTQLPKPTDTPEPTPTRAPSPLEMMWNQRFEEAFAPSDCPEPIKLELGDDNYKGQLIDTHFHMSRLWDAPLSADAGGDSYEREVLLGDFPMHLPILGKNITMTETACRLEREGTDSRFAFFFAESERPGQLRPSLDVVRRSMGIISNAIRALHPAYVLQ